MPLYVIERKFADRLDLTGDDVRAIDAVNGEEGVDWLFSFISADKLRTYCLYEAPSPDAIFEAARIPQAKEIPPIPRDPKSPTGYHCGPDSK